MRWENIIQEADTDFVWATRDQPANESTKLIVFNQNESGFATFQGAMGLVGSREPVLSIFSKLLQVSAFNSIPEPAFPEWRMYETFTKSGKRVWVLRVSNVHPAPKEGMADHSWLYTYPVIRDVIKHLSSYGVDEMIYITANQVQSSFGYDRKNYLYLKPTQLAIYDWHDKDADAYPVDENGKEWNRDIIATVPAWHFCSLFQSFCANNNLNHLIYVGCDSGAFVDEVAPQTLLLYLEENHDIWRSFDGKEQMEKVHNLLSDLATMTEARVLDGLQGGALDDWI
tara:strand:- start:39 stop:890 length:852 start_codon:yes stop_codon:yes gene_type:complete